MYNGRRRWNTRYIAMPIVMDTTKAAIKRELRYFRAGLRLNLKRGKTPVPFASEEWDYVEADIPWLEQEIRAFQAAKLAFYRDHGDWWPLPLFMAPHEFGHDKLPDGRVALTV